jgi:hypothetical protein
MFRQISNVSLKLSMNRSQKVFVKRNQKNWLENDDQKCGQLFRNFMETHRFRSYKGFDVMSKTWRENSMPLIETKQVLQV